MQVNVIDGSRGELTVEVNGHVVARKTDDKMPNEKEVVDAIRHEPANA